MHMPTFGAFGSFQTEALSQQRPILTSDVLPKAVTRALVSILGRCPAWGRGAAGLATGDRKPKLMSGVHGRLRMS